MEYSSINSKQYWEQRFINDWEENSGRQQTLYFCQLAESLFPDWFNALLIEGATVADVGCAEGDCTHFLASRYPKSTFTGIDFSGTAIQKAKSYYPEQTFIQGSIQEIDLNFDVVFTSNTLEHFTEPFEILKHLFRITNKYLAILIPFQEYERFKEHFYTFDYHDFDLNVDNFTIVFSEEYDCGKQPNIYWKGKQLLVIYAHKDMLTDHNLTLRDYINSLSTNYNNVNMELNNLKSQVMQFEKINAEQSSIITSQQETILVNTKLVDQINKDFSQVNREKETLHQEIRGLIGIKEKLQIENEVAYNEIQQLNLQVESANQEILDLKKHQYEINQQLTDLKNALISSSEEEISITKELNYHKSQIDWLLSEKYKVDIELQAIKSSTLWVIGTKYYAFRDRTPIIKDLFKALRVWKRYGFRTLIKNVISKIKRSFKNNETPNLSVNLLYDEIVKKFNANELDGITVIPSAFEFKDLYNQRTINLAKYLAENKKAVLFVVWQWSREDIVKNTLKEVYPNVYQISLYDFFDNIECLDAFKKFLYKKAILNIPSKNWSEAMLTLKVKGFEIIYDIMDEWEEFHKVGQAAWYDKEFEESFILNANRVYAVSKPLVNKFSYLRKDISCIGNGYYTNLLGEEHKFISRKSEKKDGFTRIGYFGHLTESWFDWSLIEDILQNEKNMVEIIGYGAKEETITQLKKYSNFKYIGTIDPNMLYDYAKEWDIGLIPFKKSALSEAVDPIKVYEYIYFGLKVIVTGISHIQDYPNVFYYNYDKEDKSIVGFIEEVKSNKYSKEVEEKINHFLVETTWEKRFEKMLGNSINCYTEIYNYDSN